MTELDAYTEGSKGMRARVMGGAAVIAVAALGAFAAIGFGGVGGRTAAQMVAAGHATPHRAVHEVGKPTGDANAATVARRGKKARIRYFESVPVAIPGAENAEEGGTLSCPKKTKVVSGYFATGAPGVALSVSALGATFRDWDIAAFNTTNTPNTVIFGIVCAQNVK
jgi:hypothetical protein